MRNIFGILIVVLALVFVVGIPAATDAPPAWAYGTPPTPPPPAQPAPDDGSLKHLSGSNAQFTLTQIRDAFGPADWYPGDHPQMPDVVAHGRKPDVRACSLCHYPNGKGRPENAPVASYPTSYFIQQMMDFKNGLRKSSDPKKANTNLMIGFAKSMTDDEIRQAAEYFGCLLYTSPSPRD